MQVHMNVGCQGSRFRNLYDKKAADISRSAQRKKHIKGVLKNKTLGKQITASMRKDVTVPGNRAGGEGFEIKLIHTHTHAVIGITNA